PTNSFSEPSALRLARLLRSWLLSQNTVPNFPRRNLDQAQAEAVPAKHSSREEKISEHFSGWRPTWTPRRPNSIFKSRHRCDCEPTSVAVERVKDEAIGEFLEIH